MKAEIAFLSWGDAQLRVVIRIDHNNQNVKKLEWLIHLLMIWNNTFLDMALMKNG